MNPKFKIEAFAELDGQKIACKGIIEIRTLDAGHNTAYASWQFSDANGQHLAGKSTNYYLGEDHFTQEVLISRILEDIITYRMGRNRVFTDVKLI